MYNLSCVVRTKPLWQHADLQGCIPYASFFANELGIVSADGEPKHEL